MYQCIVIKIYYGTGTNYIYTNSIIAIGAPSDLRAPNFNTLVYPPLMPLYFGAMTSKSFLVSLLRFVSLAMICLRVARSPFFARVTSFSMNGRSSFAFGRVVLIFSRTIKLSAKDFKSAALSFFSLPNFLLLFPCLIPLKILINKFHLIAPYVGFLTGQV